ncbi:MAG: hypothetical protein Kow0042_30970 [Calditrichia bacterium]
MKIKIFLIAILLSCFEQDSGLGKDQDFFQINIYRLSEKAVVISGTQFNTNQLALKSQKGIILIDTGISPHYAAVIRDSLNDIFNTDTYAYIINTHHHWDHVQGNQVFKEAVIIGHQNIETAMRAQSTAAIGNSPVLQQIRKEGNIQPGQLPPPPSHILVDGTNGFKITPPSLNFWDRLKIDAGDLTLYLLWYGESHTDNDIIIYCPEEAVLAVGDLFYKKSLPPFSQERDLDVPRWLHVLNWILDEKRPLKIIVPGHEDLFSRKDLNLYRNYIAILWEEIGKAVSNGHALQKIQNKLDLKRRFPVLQKRDNIGNNGGSLHKGNVIAIWRQRQKIR